MLSPSIHRNKEKPRENTLGEYPGCLDIGVIGPPLGGEVPYKLTRDTKAMAQLRVANKSSQTPNFGENTNETKQHSEMSRINKKGAAR